MITKTTTDITNDFYNIITETITEITVEFQKLIDKKFRLK